MGSEGILDVNRTFYDALWRDARIERPERFNTWPLLASLLQEPQARLEIGPGLRPRLPIAGTAFVDASRAAAAGLRAAGGDAVVADAASLPFARSRFTLVAVFDLLEHHPDDRATLTEIDRVLAADGRLVCAVPIHEAAWTEFDDFVGHFRRYEPTAFVELLREHGFVIEKSAVFGMQPKSRWLVRFGMWMMTRFRARAMRWYNDVLMPIAMRSQRPLLIQDDLLPTEGVDEILVVCRRPPL